VEQVVNPGPTPSPLNTGNITEVDNADSLQESNGSGATNATTLATVTHPTWPVEIDIVYVAGTTKVKLSIQSRPLQEIFHKAFENVRSGLLFVNAFPDAAQLPGVVLRALLDAADGLRIVRGQYNASAACVHQRLLSDEDYQAKMIRLVSSTTTSSMV
jgi:hypothetical protein